MTAVRIEQLTKDFLTGFWRPVPKRALDALSFDIPVGGVFGLLGPNGAGKSTTLKLLVDLLRPTSGQAEVLGRAPGDTAARQRLGFLPENPTFYDHLSAEELLTYFAGLFGFKGGERRRRASAALDRVGLAADRRRPIRQYSKGMVQRVGLAQALINDPELVILDEPMSGLDPIGRREVRAMISDLGRDGRTVLFSSHILSDAEELCDRVAILARGRLVGSGRVSDLTSRDVTGWDVVVAGGSDQRYRELTSGGVVRVLVGGRYALELPATVRPETVIAAAVAEGATLESVTPRRATLEDVFVQSVAQSPAPPGAIASGHEVAR
jgi:ABC-2 type transport system ATP-binding protein